MPHANAETATGLTTRTPQCALYGSSTETPQKLTLCSGVLPRLAASSLAVCDWLPKRTMTSMVLSIANHFTVLSNRRADTGETKGRGGGGAGVALVRGRAVTTATL